MKSFAFKWHSESKGMVSEVTNEEIFLEKVKHIKYHKSQNNKIDRFFSVNSFIAKRLKDNVFELVGIAVDVDFKDYIEFEYVVRLLEDQEFDFTIPRPSYINFSGNGLHVYWKYNEPIPARTKANKIKKNLLFLHEKINKLFADILTDYGADKQATDITRLLRNTGTINSKNNTKVENIRDYEISYSLEELQMWLPKLEEKETRLKKVISSVSYIRNYYTLHNARLEDIQRLSELRGFDCRGHRELLCFLTRYYSYILSGEAEKAKEVMLELNCRFIEPLREYRLIIDTKSAERAVERYLVNKEKGYNYSNKRLIDILNITDEEQKYLKTIISTKEKYYRKNTKRNADRRNDNGLTNREQDKQDKLKLILELKKQGLKQKEIAEILGVAKSLVSMYLKNK